MEKFVVTRQEAGGRFDKYLKKLLPQASSGFLYKMLRKKNITLNEKKAAGNEVIAENDVVKLFFSEETFRKFSGGMEGQESKTAEETAFLESYRRAFRELKDISVIYEDEDILVLNKPAGVLSQKAEKEDVSLNEWMVGYLLEKKEIMEDELGRFRPSVCNRLDRNTSGLVLCGKTLRGSQFLSQILKDRSLHKYYLTYVKGRVEHSITLKGYLRKEEEKNRSEILSGSEYRQKVQAVPEMEKEYRKIEMVIEPLSYIEKRDCTKLRILLVTGKSHQIRAHLSAIGHPVLGDKKYGWKPDGKEDQAFLYQLLHAWYIEFPKTDGAFAHLSGKHITAPVPELLKKAEEETGR